MKATLSTLLYLPVAVCVAGAAGLVVRLPVWAMGKAGGPAWW
jgi:hypothetical protein